MLGAEVKPTGEKHILTVKVRLPTQGWKVELRPLPSIAHQEVYEFEAMGQAPPPTAAQALEERAVSQPIELKVKPNEAQVMVYGKSGVYFAQIAL